MSRGMFTSIDGSAILPARGCMAIVFPEKKVEVDVTVRYTIYENTSHSSNARFFSFPSSAWERIFSKIRSKVGQ